MYLISEKLRRNKEITNKNGAMGANIVANAGEIRTTIFVEQQTTPLAKAEEPAKTVETEEVDFCNLLVSVLFAFDEERISQ
jgi:hypothetical protein